MDPRDVDERRSASLRAIEEPAAEEPALALTDDSIPPTLSDLLLRMPTDPGVYLMKDKKGKIIYVGKAQNLRNRVRSYFTRSGDNRPFVAFLERLPGDIETVVTRNEEQGLLLVAGDHGLDDKNY